MLKITNVTHVLTVCTRPRFLGEGPMNKTRQVYCLSRCHRVAAELENLVATIMIVKTQY